MIWNIGNGQRPNGNPGKTAFGEPGKICLSEVAGPWPKPLRRGERGVAVGGLRRDDRQLGEGGDAGGRARKPQGELAKRIPRESTAGDDADFHGPGVITGRNAEDLKVAAVQ